MFSVTVLTSLKLFACHVVTLRHAGFMTVGHQHWGIQWKCEVISKQRPKQYLTHIKLSASAVKSQIF